MKRDRKWIGEGLARDWKEIGKGVGRHWEAIGKGLGGIGERLGSDRGSNLQTICFTKQKRWFWRHEWRPKLPTSGFTKQK